MNDQKSLRKTFLKSIMEEKIAVSIYLINGVQLKGYIDSFDDYSVLLKNDISQIVFKHAISTIVPTKNVTLVE